MSLPKMSWCMLPVVALLLIRIPSVQSFNEKPGAGSVPDTRPKPAASTSTRSGYEPAEQLCFTILNGDSCALMGNQPALYAEGTIGSCEEVLGQNEHMYPGPGRDPDRPWIPAAVDASPLGTCAVRIALTQEALQDIAEHVDGASFIAATYDLDCEITCDHEGGHGVPALQKNSFLTSRGKLQWVQHAAVSSRYTPTGMTGCMGDAWPKVARYAERASESRSNGTSSAGHNTQTGRRGISGAGLPQTGPSTGDGTLIADGRSYYYTHGLVASGHATLTSRHEPKFRQGHLSGVVFPWFALLGWEITEPAPPGVQLVYGDPFSATVTFWDDDGYY